MKDFFKNSTTFTKVLIFAVIVGAAIFAYKMLRKKGVISDKDVAITTAGGTKIEKSKDADYLLAYNTFPGMEGILLMNGGMEPNEDGQLFKEYGIKLQIKKMDNLSDTRDGLKSGALDLAYCTIDALPIEMGSGSAMLELKVKNIMKVNESRGADAIVATAGINKVADLKGKKIAYAIGTASNTLLINMLETAGMSIKDIEAYKVENGVDAASAFKAGTVDAACVWAPDDEDCVAAVKGSKILVTTKTATQIIADGLLVTAENLEKKREGITKIVEAWLKGNALINTDPKSKSTANALFAKGFDFPADLTALSADKIRFSTLNDNKQFYGFDATFTGVTGEKMYGRMSVKYADLGLAQAPAAWRIVSDASVIEQLLQGDLAKDPKQASEGAVVFAAPTKADETIESKGSKVVSITFPTAGFDLDDQAKTVIDREVTAVAQAFAKARIRVEGNTDNVGNPISNKQLSLKRAQAVVNYLVSEHKFNRNKFIVLGNGQGKPVADNNSEEGKAKNRRTDFNFIW